MQDVIIYWDKNIFNGKIRQLPTALTLYTQLYLHDKGAWSLVFNFELSAKEQGLTNLAKVDFLFADDAPKGILTKGFIFDFFDGSKKIGVCEII